MEIEIIESDGHFIIVRFTNGMFHPFVIDLKNRRIAHSIDIRDIIKSINLHRYNFDLRSINTEPTNPRISSSLKNGYFIERIFEYMLGFKVKYINYKSYVGDIILSNDNNKNTKLQLEKVTGEITIKGVSKIPLFLRDIELDGRMNIMNSSIKDLQNSPKKVKSLIAPNVGLESLKGAPREVINKFDVSSNKLISFKYSPDIVESFNADYNYIKSTKYLPKEISHLSLLYNPLEDLSYLPKEIDILNIENIDDIKGVLHEHGINVKFLDDL